MTKRKLEVAYAHYLKTGDVFGQWEGAVIRGKGPPQPPMEYEQFERMSRSIPKPEVATPPRPDPDALHVIRSHVDVIQWPAWMASLKPQDRERAEQTGVIVTTALWPARGRLLGIGDRHTYGRLVNREASNRRGG